MIGVRPGRHPIREPNQDAFFEWSQKAVLQSLGRLEVALGLHIALDVSARLRFV